MAPGDHLQPADLHPHMPGATWVLETLREKGLDPGHISYHMNNTQSLIETLNSDFGFQDTGGDSKWDADHWKAWEATGLYFSLHSRYYEALSVFSACYSHLLRAQVSAEVRLHKGKVLIWLSDAYWHLGWPVHAKRYLMLALCEDLLYLFTDNLRLSR